jgi:hypothetical protein
MEQKKVNVQMLEPQPTNGIRTIDTTSCQTIAKPLVKCSKTVRAVITRILYQNSSDDSECLRIKFEKIQGVIDEIMLYVG